MTSFKVDEELTLFVSDNPSITTFMNDDTLPKLPLPSLEDTLQRYLESCRPILTDVEFVETKNVVEKFLAKEGAVLHQKLEARAEKCRNWMEDWWLHYAYLAYRGPLLPYLNTGGPEALHLSTMPPIADNFLKYASLFLYTSLILYDILREERLRPQTSMKGAKFSMDQFRRLFNTCRIPGKEHDSLFTCWKTKREGNTPCHIVVLCHGHIWIMEPFDSSGKILRLSELESQLSEIRRQSDAMGEGPGVCSLTTTERVNWCKNREWLRAISPKNITLLDDIESAVLVMVLDDSQPRDMSEASWQFLAGDAGNRWVDKSLSLIATRNGYLGTNVDHTPYDAMVLVVLTGFQHTILKIMDVDALEMLPLRPFVTQPQLREFILDPYLISAIEEAKRLNKKMNYSVLVSFTSFDEFGKDWMKSQGVHPDAFVQMSLQLAYFRTYKQMAPTYETATTRQFYHGRTETVRSCTNEAKRFVVKMQDPHASNRDKVQAFKAACAAHDRLMRQCQAAQGIDRHMLGLYLTALESGLDIPELFTDPAYVKTGGGANYVLSTSTVGYLEVIGGASPMVPHGYGCFYTMPANKILLFVSSYRDGGTIPAEQFAKVITDCLRDMKRILESLSAKL